jgi:two-component system, cell cycle response regulator DivK
MTGLFCETAAGQCAAPSDMTTSIDTTTRTSSVRPRRRPRVLVVDDARAESDLYSAHLRGAGYDVQVATDGFEAVARAVAWRPDAIVMDLAAARLDGWEITRRLKVAAATRDIPVIAVSVRDLVHAGERARAAGCAACLAKPFAPELLRAELDRQLGQHRPRPRRRGPAGRV